MEPAKPTLSELVAYIREHGASAASRDFKMGYANVRSVAKSAGLKLRRGRRRNRELAARNMQIRVLRMEGFFLRVIAEKFELGRERVRQILAATGGDPIAESLRHQTPSESQSLQAAHSETAE